MARKSTEQRLTEIHAQALTEFSTIQSALRSERLQCLQDRRFYSIAGAQWEGNLAEVYANKPKFEVNKIHLSVIRIINEYRNNRITVDFISKDGDTEKKTADMLDGLYRADEQDSTADEAYDNAFEEAVSGGFGAWRIRTEYENEEDPDDDSQRIRIEPIFDADSSVFFDLEAKRQDKSDAKHCFVITAIEREAYKNTWGDDPATWAKDITQLEFDWETPDVVYVAEYYRVEEKSEVAIFYRNAIGEEERYTQSDFDADEQLLSNLEAVGSIEVRRKRFKTKKVRKYLLSGGKVLEDFGYIAGKNIPIIPVYGKRWFIDNVERCMGHVRLAKDAQRIKNMQLSKLAEISAASSVEKPILTPEQVAGHTVMWQEDNIKSYPYLLINPIKDMNGNETAAPPVGYTRSPQIPPAMAALLQVTETDMQDVLGSPQQADKMVSNISGKAVEMIQQRLDMQAFIYMSNFAKAMRRCGQVWLSMAKDIYSAERKKMKVVTASKETATIEMLKPSINEQGEMVYENDISKANYDVTVDVGPSSSSQKAATVRALTGMLAITSDPETQQVLQSAAMMNMEGEGIGELQGFFRKRLVKIGAIEPTEEEAQAMMIELQGKPQDPNAIFLQAAAEEAVAKAAKARADTVETIASAELKRAQTVKTLSDAEQGQFEYNEAPKIEPVQQQILPPIETQPVQISQKEQLEIESMQLDNEMKARKIINQDAEIEKLRSEINTPDKLNQLAQNMQESIQKIEQNSILVSDNVNKIGEIMNNFAETNIKNTEKAISAIRKNKKLTLSNGKTVRIETDE